ncbi:MAG: DNA internalization-related competence protein ComEC/Rec2 [Bryobacteraceae bacterium]
MAVAPVEKQVVWNEPMLIPAIGLAAGVLLERLAPFTLLEASVAGGVFALLALAPGLIARRRICAGFACCALGVGTAVWHSPGPAPVIDAPASEAVILAGCVVEPSVFSENREQFTLELAHGARGRVSLNLREGQAAPKLRYGQRVELEGRVRKPHNFGNPGAFDFENYMARRQIYWNISTRTGAAVTVLAGECGSKWEGWLFGLRSEALERLEKLYANDAYKTIMMQALLTGENTRLEKAWTEHYRRTGTYHALVISGLHLTVLAGYLLVALRYSTGRPGLSLALAFLAAWIYAGASGMTAPIGRAAGGFTLFLISRFWHRQTHILNSLATVVVCFLLVDPGQLFEGSFLLSVLSVLAIGALAGPLFEAYTRPVVMGFRDLGRDQHDLDLEWRVCSMRVEARLIAQTVAVWTRIPEKHCITAVALGVQAFFLLYEIFMLSAVVQVALALPMALFFHRVSLSGMAANVLIVPLMNAVVVIGFLAVLTKLSPLAWVAGWLLEFSRRVAEFFSRLEPDWRIPDPPLWLALAFTCALIVLALVARRRSAVRWVAFATVCVLFATLVVHPFAPLLDAGQLEVTAVDVGQGDSVLVVTPEGRTVIVDAGGVPGFKGRPKPRLDIGEDVVSTYLWTRSIQRIDVLALTHAHEDHSGGLAALIANFHPRELWVGAMGESEVWQRLRAVAERHGVRIVARKAGEAFALGGAQFRVLAPFPDHVPDVIPRNNDSLVMTVRLGSRSFLLTGDAEKEIEWRLADAHALERVDVLKLGHHGSRTSSTAEFLDLARPTFAVVSAGLDNLYRHPHPDVLARLEERGVRVLRTDRGGQIRFLTDGQRLDVTAFHSLTATPPTPKRHETPETASIHRTRKSSAQ